MENKNMQPFQIVPLQGDHLPSAAGLVCERYRLLRERLPILPPRWENPAAVLELLLDLSRESAGVAALRDGELVGFMMNIVISNFMGKRAVWSPEWANTAFLEDSRRIYQEMYAALAPRWLADGCHIHLVSLLASDLQGREAWHWLGFGLVNIDAMRGLEPVAGDASGIDVRPVAPADAPALDAMDRALAEHVSGVPAYFFHEPIGFSEHLGQPGYAAFLAWRGAEPLGFIALEPGMECDSVLMRDEGTVNIHGAFVRETARCAGVAAALLDHALAWARSQSYARCAVDFESANIHAARFWPRWFTPVNYSLIRWIDERVAGENK